MVTTRESDSKRAENEIKRCMNSIVLPRLGSRSESGHGEHVPHLDIAPANISFQFPSCASLVDIWQ